MTISKVMTEGILRRLSLPSSWPPSTTSLPPPSTSSSKSIPWPSELLRRRSAPSAIRIDYCIPDYTKCDLGLVDTFLANQFNSSWRLLRLSEISKIELRTKREREKNSTWKRCHEGEGGQVVAPTHCGNAGRVDDPATLGGPP